MYSKSKSVNLAGMGMDFLAMHSHTGEYYNIAKKEVHPLQGFFTTHTGGVEETVSGR